ncbi:hypothetical protein HGK82_00755 [Ochrobactrum sp. MT180101]|nr:hypothetical protein HGK82_00755 [Ochrobactrum sp. MT180101]
MSNLPSKTDQAIDRVFEVTLLMTLITSVVIASVAAVFFVYAIYQTVADIPSDGDTFTLNRTEWACASERSIPRCSSTAILVTKKCDVWVRRQP